MDGIRERRVGELGEGSRGGAKDREGVEGKSQLGQSEERGREGQRERSSGFTVHGRVISRLVGPV